MNTRSLDLNLLAVFQALSQERSVTAAARKIGVSQPAISYALAKLRDSFGDPLFVRVGSRMEPTARAENLAAAIGRVMELVNTEVLQRITFEPASVRRVFTLCMTDIGEANLASALAERLMAAGPGLAFRIQSLSPDLLEKSLAAGETDLAVGFFPDLKGASVYQQTLYETGFVCIARRSNPHFGGRLTRRGFLTAPHVALRSGARSQGFIERDLRAARLNRNVRLTVQHLMSLIDVLGRTDLIAVVPVEAAQLAGKALALEVRPLPYRSSRFAVCQHWHSRFHGDPANQWLRAQVRELFQRAASHAD